MFDYLEQPCATPQVSFATFKPPEDGRVYEDMKNPWVKPPNADPQKVFVAGLGSHGACCGSILGSSRLLVYFKVSY